MTKVPYGAKMTTWQTGVKTIKRDYPMSQDKKDAIVLRRNMSGEKSLDKYFWKSNVKHREKVAREITAMHRRSKEILELQNRHNVLQEFYKEMSGFYYR